MTMKFKWNERNKNKKRNIFLFSFYFISHFPFYYILRRFLLFHFACFPISQGDPGKSRLIHHHFGRPSFYTIIEAMDNLFWESLPVRYRID